MVGQERLVWQQHAREEFAHAVTAIDVNSRIAHIDLAILNIQRCRAAVPVCPDRAQCRFGTSCAVSCRLAGLETLDIH